MDSTDAFTITGGRISNSPLASVLPQNTERQIMEHSFEIGESDLLKILDALRANELFHRHRDEMNGAIHLAKEIRFSPITSETISARERLEKLLGVQDEKQSP